MDKELAKIEINKLKKRLSNAHSEFYLSLPEYKETLEKIELLQKHKDKIYKDHYLEFTIFVKNLELKINNVQNELNDKLNKK